MLEEAHAVERSLTKYLGSVKRDGMAEVISPRNFHRFSHGRRWSSRANPQSVSGELQTMSVEWTIPFQDILYGDLSLIQRTIAHLLKEMHSAQMKILYKTITETCDANGQTVSVTAEGTHAAAFLEMLRRIEFTVDRDGQVPLPTIHAGSEMAEAMMAELNAQPPEFAEEVERKL